MDRSTRFTLLDVLHALAVAAGEGAAGMLEDIRRARRERQARRELHRLSDHLLKDIGLLRGQIDALYRD